MIFRPRTILAILFLVSIVVLSGCGGSAATLQPTVIRISATPPPATDTPAAPAELPATGSTPQPTSPPAAAATPTSPPAVEPAKTGETVTLSFQNTLTSVEDLDDLRILLLGKEGIMTVTGTEVSINITYDPAVYTVEDLMTLLSQLDHPVKPPE